ncbi:MAG: T9SS type A sorting domain-containing protein [Ignavibacteria bacterium]|nr:T9SS type A sorting domain-containing protein [Ignavibacteria bacterium]
MNILNKTAKILKLKYLIIFTAIFFCTVNIFGQSITWQRTYDGVEHLSDGSFSACNADGDNIYVAGITTFLPNRDFVYVMKLNPFGDTIWTRTLTPNINLPTSMARAITPSGDGGCVITGDAGNPFTIKLDLNGNIIWNYEYGTGFKQCFSIIRTSDGGYIACGRDAGCSTDCAYILKIDSMGSLQWQQTYPAGYWKNFESITETNDLSGYIAVGFDIASINDTSRGYIVKINYAGGIIWERRYLIGQSTSIRAIIKHKDFYFIAGRSNNRLFYGKINEQGDTSSIKTFQTNSSEYFAGFNIINDNKFVMASSKDSIETLNGHVFTFDSTGTVINDKIYLSEDVLNMYFTLPLSGGDILFGGSVDFDPIHTRNDIYVLRTDSLLNAPPPIGLINQNINIPLHFKLYQNFPNPFNPVTSIKYDIPQNGQVTIKIYDLLGREVFTYSDHKLAGSYELKFDGSKLASGMYIYQITADMFTDTKKMVLLK